MSLDEYIQEYEDKPCIWGEDDCTAWAAHWVERNHGVNLTLPKYSSRQEANELIHNAGSLISLWQDALCGILRMKGEPEHGDVGIIETQSFGQVGVIFTHGGYAAWRSLNSVSFITPRDIKGVWGS